MKISIITPARAGARNGNRNTALRWARFLRELRHRVIVEQQWSGVRSDVMIALHARRSFDSIRRYAEAFPTRPLVVVLTGTDVYRDIHADEHAKRSLELATRLIVLQEMAAKELSSSLRGKTRVIYQSARKVERQAPLAGCFEVIVSGHLRTEKDPFRAAAAVAHLPGSSRIRITHVGGALESDMAAEARAWMAREPRYKWLGEVAHGRALRILARARLMVISSRLEGGANVVSEALRSGVPVIASKVSGNVGMLGPRYPGYYPVGDERALARLLHRAECDRSFHALLTESCAARAPLIAPDRERAALDDLMSELQSPDTVNVRTLRGTVRATPLLKTPLVR
jgi:putative glycosyltransferase (TIGR04348 family)